MRAVVAILKVSLAVLLIAWAGCEPPVVTTEPRQTPERDPNDVDVYARYAAAKIEILPLTQLLTVGDAEQASQINIFVSLLDPFGCQIKSPGVLRFELYKHVGRSAEPKSGRIAIWPDIDLTDPGKNNNHWRDFLRCYKLNLDFDPQAGQSYVLQATCLCPNGRRLAAEFVLRHTE